MPRYDSPNNRILTLEEAEERLKPYKERLDTCIKHGWNAWRSDYKHKHHVLSPRARAAIVFDEIVDCAQREFACLPGVKFVRKSNSFMLFIGDDITLRFKKIRKNGKCSNIRTRQQALFQAQLQLPNMLAGTLVHAGYSLDELQREIERKLVVCQFENRVLWTISLDEEAGAVGGFEVMPTPPTPSQPPKPRFVAKGPTEKKAKATKAGKAE